MTVDEQEVAQVGKLLGRSPRGLEEVAVRDSGGEPLVIRVCSLVDDKPFPTLYWLVCPQLNYRIDSDEATGLIARLQSRIDADSSLQERMRGDHVKHIALRESYMTETLRKRIDALNYRDVFMRKGIGGIEDFSRIRCLHTWYAAHLVVPNTVGELLDIHWREEGE